MGKIRLLSDQFSEMRIKGIREKKMRRKLRKLRGGRRGGGGEIHGEKNHVFLKISSRFIKKIFFLAEN